MISTVHVSITDRAIFFGKETRKTFSFDADEFSYPPDLDDYLAVALCGRKDISITFHTEETAMVSETANRAIARVAGYGAVATTGLP